MHFRFFKQCAANKCFYIHNHKEPVDHLLRIFHYIDGCVTLRTVAVRWPIFKQKKECATIRFGFNYCSIRLSQPQSRDTVPLIVVNKLITLLDEWFS
jgi:hypothetical protein